MPRSSRKTTQKVPVAEDKKGAAKFRRAILEIVEKQLKMRDLPEVRQTLERLMSLGYSRQQAVEMIASALIKEIWVVTHDQKEHDPERYKSFLDELQ